MACRDCKYLDWSQPDAVNSSKYKCISRGWYCDPSEGYGYSCHSDYEKTPRSASKQKHEETSPSSYKTNDHKNNTYTSSKKQSSNFSSKLITWGIIIIVIIGLIQYISDNSASNKLMADLAVTSGFDYSSPIEKGGVVHYNRWKTSQHTGSFKDKSGKTFTGIGMYSDMADHETVKSGTAYVKYDLPVGARKFTTSISLDSEWCGTKEYGKSTFQIFIDGELKYSKSYTETFKAEYLDIEIPKNSKTITLQVYQEYPEGSRGNHACFFGTPVIIKDSIAQNATESITTNLSDDGNKSGSRISNKIKIPLIIFLLWNLFVFVAYILEDKCLWLIEDKTLLIFSACMGALGALAFMLIFREKTDELKFKIGVPFFLILHIFIIIMIYSPDFRNLIFQNLFQKSG